MGELVRFKLMIKPGFVGFVTADDGNMTDWHTATRIIAEKDAEIAVLRAQFALTRSVATAAPELNMGNYDDDQVRELNNAMIEICQIIDPLAAGWE